MSTIVIRCPHTAGDISAEIDIDRKGFDLLPDGYVFVFFGKFGSSTPAPLASARLATVS